MPNMSDRLFLSIVIPVFNMEKYLELCLDSVITQGMKDYEVIVVNDGSTDRSSEIIDRYCGAYPDIICCIDQENQGLGPARNAGISRAKGEYVMLIDSDDWLEENVVPNLCAFIKKYDFDLVVFDAYTAKSPYGGRNLSSGHPVPSPVMDKAAAVRKSTDPAHAWKRIYKRALFAGVSYPAIWFEDVALTPVLTSRAKKLGYFKVPVYNYREREDSITAQPDDQRNLGIVQAWKYVLDNADQECMEQIVQAVARSIKIFIDYRPKFRNDYMQFYEQHSELFGRFGGYGALTEESIREKIPRVIHYCWFGGNEKSDLIKRCIESWKRYMPDYQIMEWNEDNCNVYEIPFTQQAYVKKKWAYVTDYFRFKILNEYGGIYLDTDVEANASPDKLLRNLLFMSFEKKDVVNAAVLGSVPGHIFLQKALEHYQGENYISRTGYLKNFTIPKVLEYLLVKNEYGVKFDGSMQELKDGVAVYPVDELCLNVFNGKNIFEHHFDASWWDTKPRESYKFQVLKEYFRDIFS